MKSKLVFIDINLFNTYNLLKYKIYEKLIVLDAIYMI